MTPSREATPLIAGTAKGGLTTISDPAPDPPAKALDGCEHPHFGAHTIGLFGSLALTINNISGPGMLEFPSIFQSAGGERVCRPQVPNPYMSLHE